MSSSDTPPGAPIEPTELLGTVFADRYRLARLVTEGANSTVFDAADVESGRIVTVKVIRPEMTTSPSFRRRFDETMRAVAALSHPNIAAVYDWGNSAVGDESTAYVVVEQLTGGSLRDMFDRARLLSPSQALAVGLDACRGLDYAHRRGFVHSELTPSKLVFGDDRRLRITDFGLAALLNEPAWQSPENVPTHVAWYASPEQGRVREIDDKTDVYALALTLHEAVTGTLPFRHDSTVASLAARIGKLMPVSADLGQLAAVLEHASRPEADERSSAAEFGRELVQAASKLPRPDPLPLLSTGLFDTPADRIREPADPTGGVVRPEDELVIALADAPDLGTDERSAADAESEGDRRADDEPGGEPVVATAAAASVAAAAAAVASSDDTSVDETRVDETGVDDRSVDETGVDDTSVDDTSVDDTSVDETRVDETGVDDTSVESDDDPGPDDSHANAAVGAPDTEAGEATDDDGDAETDLDGVDVDDDIDDDINADLDGDSDVEDEAVVGPEELVILPIDSEYGDPTAEPIPFPADPVPSVAADTDVIPVTTDGPPTERRRRGFPWKILLALIVLGALIGLGVLATRLFETPVYTVPDLVETPEAEALNLIATNGWEVTRNNERSDTVPTVGQVVRTAPMAGTELAEGEPFLMVISDGPLLRELPESTGVPLSQAQTVLVERSLGADTVEQFDEDVPEGTVISWSVTGDATLAAGSLVEPGTTVELIVSSGPEPRTVPDVTDETVDSARTELTALRLELTVASQEFSDDVPLGTILSQQPEPETTVERGAEVTVTVSRGPDLVLFPDLSSASTYEVAAEILFEAGFEARLTFGDAQGEIRSVRIDGEEPDVGETFKRGTQVDISAL